MPRETCPNCNEVGVDMPELGPRLLACMNVKCRVNEFEVDDE
jgi:hypothetical protein